MQAILQAAARPDSVGLRLEQKEIGLLLQISSWNLPVPDLSALLSGRWNQLGCGAGKSIVLGQFAAFALQLLSPALERLLKSGEGRSRGFEPFSASHLDRRWKNLNPKLLVSPAAKKWWQNYSLRGNFEMVLSMPCWGRGGEDKKPHTNKQQRNLRLKRKKNFYFESRGKP